MSAVNEPVTSSLAAACDAVFTLDAPALKGLIRQDDGWELRDGPEFVVPEDLIGFVAPPSWDGVAVVTTGTAHELDGGRSLRARITYALDRDRSGASSITTVEGTTRIEPGQGPAVGHLADVCHRMLGLPAAPEPSSPIDLLAAGWLSDVLSAHLALGSGFPIDDWEGVASLCPFERRPAELRDQDGPSWADVHAAIVRSGRGWADLSADDVAWTDPPTLARLMLATRPALRQVYDELARVAPPSVMRRVLARIDDARGDAAPI